MKTYLDKTHPDLASQWHQTKNCINPSEITAGSNKKVWWKGKCGHEWDAAVSSRVNGNGCPYCSGRKTCPKNSLSFLYPELLKEWHPTKNKITPEEVTGRGDKRVWWLGLCGHEWDATISNRTIIKTKCPYCAGRKIDSTNSLLSKAPMISKEWHPTKNVITADKIHYKSGKKAWWLGSCGHEWNSVVYHRINGVGCPYCKESKGEKLIAEILQKLNVKFSREHRISECRDHNPLPFDFIINTTPIKLIEYQGAQHYDSVEWFGGKESLKTLKRRDDIKEKFCKQHNIPLLIIPYWKFDTIETIIVEFLGI